MMKLHSIIFAGTKAFGVVVWETSRRYVRERAWRLAAAVAFYALFAVAPLMLFLVVLGGILFNQQEFQQQMLEQLRLFIGDQGASAAGEMLANFEEPPVSLAGYAVATMTLLFGATNALGQLRDNINRLWEVRTRAGDSLPSKLALKHLLYLAIVAAIGLLLMGSMFLGSALLAIESAMKGSIPGLANAFRAADFLSTVVIITLLCALIYRYLPDARACWRDVWIGSGVTAVLFAIGKQLVALVLSRSDVASAYGAVSSIIVFLLWVYLSTQIVLFGAAFTATYAREHGDDIHPINRE